MEWMSKYIPLFYVDGITYPRANTDDVLTNLC